MFDDPKKELQELEGRLLAAEMDDEEFQEFYNGVLDEFGPKADRDGTTVSTGEPPIRNFANGYGRTVHNQPLGSDGDEILDDDEPVEPRRGIKGLAVLAFLECLGIAALVMYWFTNLL